MPFGRYNQGMDPLLKLVNSWYFFVNQHHDIGSKEFFYCSREHPCYKNLCGLHWQLPKYISKGDYMNIEYVAKTYIV